MRTRGGRRRKRGAEPHVERMLWGAGLTRVAGVDEVGMGPLAGPVVAAAVVLPVGVRLDGVADSKSLTRRARECMAKQIVLARSGSASVSSKPTRSIA